VPLKPWTPPPVSVVRAFESAARHQSFTKAAEELHITQSAVSHAIRELEQRFREKLFARHGKALALTDAGKTYLAYASEALQRLRR
jgi:LysR family glycine cleavage system transcriptional activator